MNTEIQLYSYGYTEKRTYPTALLFAAGNIILPQIFHLFPHGGTIWLPIYFFTLVGAYKYGWKVGLLIALLSPLLNSLLFGMPAAAALPAITAKSVLLAAGAGFTAYKYRKISILALIAVVLFYQIAGTVFEWAWSGNLYGALQDFRMGIPGMLLQTAGGYLCIKHLIRR